ncbi:MAG: FHA domain-containing protein [Woeseiaceae bacterium]|nr:FHA domain-containing protein [Woeseiaceae bacterium]
MDLGAAGLSEQPFPTHGKPLSVIAYASHRDAIAVLRKTCATPSGVALLQGPTLSGKSTLIRSFVDSLDEDLAVAVIDGNGMNTKSLLEAALRQFGYDLDFNSTRELFAMVRVFALQQTTHGQAPLIIVENTHGLDPSALRALCELAELRVRQHSAVRFVLVSDRSLAGIVASPAMEAIAKRVIADFHLHPMTKEEARDYLHAKLRDAGSEYPEWVFPEAICDRLWEASGGWPGILDRIALLSLARAETLPVPAEDVETPALPTGTWDKAHLAEIETEMAPPATNVPTLYITHHGKTLKELKFSKPRLLIGRSEHNDIEIPSRFISRHHALLVRHGGSTFLMDLNSTNGTFVNSRRVSNQVLVDSDIVTIGHHRLKFVDPDAKTRGSLDGVEFADTVIMKSLDDLRSLLAHENTATLPAMTEDIPTYAGD